MKLSSNILAWALIICVGSWALPSRARAGFFEIGASGSYRKSIIDTDSYEESRSATGSVSYYLNEASAIELSYTNSQGRRAISEGQSDSYTSVVTQNMMGLDFMYTIGGREAAFRPYLKAGALWILEKRIVDQYRRSGVLYEGTPVEGKKGAVPSAGIGFKIALTENLSLKVGADAWTSQPTSETPVTVDVAGRAGLSIMF